MNVTDEKGAPPEAVPIPVEKKVAVEVNDGREPVVIVTPEAPRGNNRNGKIAVAIAALVVLVIVIVLAVALTGDDDEEPGYKTEAPVARDFTTGVSLITSYKINATISQRLARSVVTMEVANALDCTSIHGITLQIPLAARVASLSTIADDGCITRGEVQALEEARDTFAENAASGLPGAYVEARDDVTYSLQVSLPPMGTTLVELVIEELLRQKVGQVEFQVPLVPNEQVDQVSLEINILDASLVGIENVFQNITSIQQAFELDLETDLVLGNVQSPFKLEIPDAREHDLPRILRGEYKPDALPDKGVLYQDGNCFEYTFLPGSLVEPKSKNLFFLLDLNDRDHKFFAQAKKALNETIDLLTPQDTLTIQAFGERGTVDLWGSAKATDIEKVEAKKFLDEVELLVVAPIPGFGTNTNLHEALLECLLRSNRDAERDKGQGVVTLMVVLSNSWANIGATNRSKIASDVWNLNKEGNVKIFSIGSPRADLQLLNAIAIMNGGVTASVVDGMTEFATQMTSFFQSEFGNILLSDVEVSFEVGGGEVYGETPSIFPVLADGTEVVVRGLLNQSSAQMARTLQAVTTAISPDGSQIWRTFAVDDPFVEVLGEPNSRCFQSYAHTRITQLMHLRDVAILLGDDVVKPIVTLNNHCNETTSFADCIKAEALSLALEAELVTTGLTGLVTIDDEMCLPVNPEAEICLDGTNSAYWNEDTASREHYQAPGEDLGGDPVADAEPMVEYSYDDGYADAPGAPAPTPAPPSGSVTKSLCSALLIPAITAFLLLLDVMNRDF